MRRLIFIFIGLSMAMVVPFFLWGEAWNWSTDQALEWLHSYGQWAGLMGCLLLIGDILLPIPSTAVMAGLGLIYGPWIGGLIGGLGSFLAGFIAYGLCRTFGQKALNYLVKADDQTLGQMWFERYGEWTLVLSRWLPLLPETLACMAGFFHMRPARVATALVLGSLPMALSYAWVGHLGKQNPGASLLLSALVPPMLWWAIGKKLGPRSRS